jgi:hypothetical protein
MENERISHKSVVTQLKKQRDSLEAEIDHFRRETLRRPIQHYGQQAAHPLTGHNRSSGNHR